MGPFVDKHSSWFLTRDASTVMRVATFFTELL